MVRQAAEAGKHGLWARSPEPLTVAEGQTPAGSAGALRCEDREAFMVKTPRNGWRTQELIHKGVILEFASDRGTFSYFTVIRQRAEQAEWGGGD